jgi:outer membrane protein assembly factor BamB
MKLHNCIIKDLNIFLVFILMLFIAPITNAVTLDPAAASSDWPSAGHDFYNSGHNPSETIITKNNVNDIVLLKEYRDNIGYLINATTQLPFSGPITTENLTHNVTPTAVVADGVAYFVVGSGTLQIDPNDSGFSGTPIGGLISESFFDSAMTVIAVAVGASGHNFGDVIWSKEIVNSSFTTFLAGEPLSSGWFTNTPGQSAPILTNDAVFVVNMHEMIKLDRSTGNTLWRTTIDNTSVINVGVPLNLTWIASDPIVYNGKVIVGTASVENSILPSPLIKGSARQKLVAIDENTGTKLWEAFVTSDPTLPFPKYGSGAGLWSSASIDTQTGMLYIGTGQRHTCGSQKLEGLDINGQPAVFCPGTEISPASQGDKDYTDSLIVVNTNNGTIVKSKQFTKNDIWGLAFPGLTRDRDLGIPPTLFSIPNGKSGERKLVGIGDKEGMYYVMDRHSLNIVWQKRISTGSILGGIQSTAAYANGVLYVAGHENIDGTAISYNPLSSYGPKLINLLNYDGRTQMYALNPENGEVIWNKTFNGTLSFAPLVVANGVIYFGGSDGNLRLIDALNGNLLRTIDGFETTGNYVSADTSDPSIPLKPIKTMISAISVSNGKIFISYSPFFYTLGGLRIYGIPIEN